MMFRYKHGVIVRNRRPPDANIVSKDPNTPRIRQYAYLTYADEYAFCAFATENKLETGTGYLEWLYLEYTKYIRKYPRISLETKRDLFDALHNKISNNLENILAILEMQHDFK